MYLPSKVCEYSLTLDYATSYRWVNLRAVKRLVDTDALKIENYTVSKVPFLLIIH